MTKSLTGIDEIINRFIPKSSKTSILKFGNTYIYIVHILIADTLKLITDDAQREVCSCRCKYILHLCHQNWLKISSLPIYNFVNFVNYILNASLWFHQYQLMILPMQVIDFKAIAIVDSSFQAVMIIIKAIAITLWSIYFQS